MPITKNNGNGRGKPRGTVTRPGASKRAPCGEYRLECAEPGIRRLVSQLAQDEALYARFQREPRQVLAEAGIDLPASVRVDVEAFEIRHLRRMLGQSGPLLNFTLGGRPIFELRGRPTPPRRETVSAG